MDWVTGVHTARIRGEQMDNCAQGIWKIAWALTCTSRCVLVWVPEASCRQGIEGGGERKGLGLVQRQASLVLSSCGAKFQRLENFKLEFKFSVLTIRLCREGKIGYVSVIVLISLYKY